MGPHNAAQCELPMRPGTGLDAQNKHETEVGEGSRGGAGQRGRCTAELRLILNYDSLFAFMAKHLQLKRFSRTLSPHYPTLSLYISLSLALFVSAKSSLCCSRTHRLGLMQNTGQGHKLN